MSGHEIVTFSKLSKTTNLEVRQQYISEALFLSRTNHPHIVDLLDCGLHDTGIAYLQLPKLNNLSDNPYPHENSLIFRGNLIVSVLNILDYLCFLNFSHGDLKPDHLVFDDNGKCVVIDFAQVYSLSTNALIGTSAYLAPELFWKYPYSLQSDIFSLGISVAQLFYNTETIDSSIRKYASTLKPWSEEDLDQVSNDIKTVDQISEILSQFISFSPINRPSSGREVVTKLVSLGMTSWTLPEYDGIIVDALKHYVCRTHWYSGKTMFGANGAKRKFIVRPCHENCQNSFIRTINVFSKFQVVQSGEKTEVQWYKKGASICKQKFSIGFIPRRLPHSGAIPSTIDASSIVNSSANNINLKCDFEFHLPYLANIATANVVAEDSADPDKIIEKIESLTEQRSFGKATRLAQLALDSKQLDDDVRITLLSLKAYCICHIESPEKAEQLLNSVSNNRLTSLSINSYTYYLLTSAWVSISKGQAHAALGHLASALKRHRKDGGAPNQLIVKIYSRIATAKWLSKNLQSAQYYCNKALELADTVGCSLELRISLLLNQCLFFGESGNFLEEQRTQREIKALLYGICHSPLFFNCLHNNGIFCIRTGQINLGGAILKKAYILALNDSDSKTELARYLLALGNAHFAAGKVTNAFKAWSFAENEFNSKLHKYGSAKCQQNLAELSFLVGKKSAADEYTVKAQQNFKEIGHELGLIDVELLGIWSNFSEDLDSQRIDNVLSQCKRLKYNWGIAQALNLQTIIMALNRNWQGLDALSEEMEKLIQNSPNSFLTSDLHYIQKLTKFLRDLPEAVPEAEYKKGISAFIAGNWPLSYRLRRSQLTYLDYALANMSRPMDSIAKITKEADVEGRILLKENKLTQTNNQQIPAPPHYRSHLKTLREIASVVDRNYDVENYVQEVLDKTVEVLQASRAAIFLTSKYTEEIEVLGMSGCQKDEVTDIKNISRTLVRYALGGESTFIRDVSRQEQLDNIQSLVSKKIKSAICIPLKKDQDIIGIFYVDSMHLATHFEDFDKDFLDTLGSIISGGISTSKRLQKLNDDYMYSLSKIGDASLKTNEGLLLPSPQMKEIYRTIFKISKTEMSVLLLGQSGCGKEVLARMIHNNSLVSNGRFVAINCSAIPEQNFESELFGVAQSAFTGVAEKPGKFEIANGGTIFLDEIADLPLKMQVKLLRVIETKQVERLGSTECKKLSFRLLAATNRNLQEMVSTGTFREDLYHRINDIKIDIPPLCERPADIKVLVQHFYQNFQTQMKLSCPPITRQISNALLNYEWPGGIRELSKVMARLVVMSNGSDLSMSELPSEIQESFSNANKDTGIHGDRIDDTFQKEHIYSQLRMNNFSIRKTARQLHIPESTLRYHIQKLKIQITPLRLRA